MEKLAREQMPIQTDPLPARETRGTVCGGSGIGVGYGDTALTTRSANFVSMVIFGYYLMCGKLQRAQVFVAT
jgi:hypothetical protein